MSTSIKPTSESAESQKVSVALSEENLAALLRATASSTEPEVQHLAEDAEAAAPLTAKGRQGTPTAPAQTPASCAQPPKSPPGETVESTLALFAAVKNHRSAMLRSRMDPAAPLLDLPSAEKADTTQEPVEYYENLSVCPPKGASLEVSLPKSESPMPAPSVSIATPSWIAIGHEQNHKTPWTRLVIGFIIVAVAVVGASTFLTQKHTSKASKSASSAPKDNIPLQVQAEPLGTGLINVRWNPQSDTIAQARDGRLVITEPDRQPQILPLNRQQLTNGHVNYQSSAGWLQFQLEIVDNSGKVSGESMVTLSSKPPQTVTNIEPQVASGQSPARKVESISVPSRDADAFRPAKAVEAPPNPAPVPRPFKGPPSSVSHAGQVPVISFDQPPIILSNTPPPTLGPSATLNNLPAPAVNPLPMTKQVRVGGNLQAASLIRTVAPHYPPIAMSSHIEGTVRFTALIGKDGTVKNLQVLSGNQMLIQAATDAVKQWIYRPTLLNGDPVEVITQIDVAFTLK